MTKWQKTDEVARGGCQTQHFCQSSAGTTHIAPIGTNFVLYANVASKSAQNIFTVPTQYHIRTKN